MDAYLLITRSSEEIVKKKSKMLFTIMETMSVQSLTLPGFDQFETGRRALLCECLKWNNRLLMRSFQVHSQMVQPLEESSTPSISLTDESDFSDDDDDLAIDFSFE